MIKNSRFFKKRLDLESTLYPIVEQASLSKESL
jgi:hypothetical protein